MIRHQSPHVCNDKWARPKKLMEVTIFCSDGSDRSTRLVLDVFSDQKKILCRRYGNPLSFCFVLIHVKGRGGWRSSSERIEEGITMMTIGEEREFSWLLETDGHFLCVSEQEHIRKVYISYRCQCGVCVFLAVTWRRSKKPVPLFLRVPLLFRLYQEILGTKNCAVGDQWDSIP